MENERNNRKKKKIKPSFDDFINDCAAKLEGPMERLTNRLKHELSQTPVNTQAVKKLATALALLGAAENVALGKRDPEPYLILLALSQDELETIIANRETLLIKETVAASELVVLSYEEKEALIGGEDDVVVTDKVEDVIDDPRGLFNVEAESSSDNSDGKDLRPKGLDFFNPNGKTIKLPNKHYELNEKQRMALDMALGLNGAVWPGSFRKLGMAINPQLGDSKEANTYGHGYLNSALGKVGKILKQGINVSCFSQEEQKIYRAIANKFTSLEEINEFVAS